MSLIGNTSPPRMKQINYLQLVCILQVDKLRRTCYRSKLLMCHCEEATVLVAPWQSPERVPLVFYYLWQTIIFAVILLHSVVLVCHCWCKSPTAPLPRPPAPHGQGHTLLLCGGGIYTNISVLNAESVYRRKPTLQPCPTAWHWRRGRFLP